MITITLKKLTLDYRIDRANLLAIKGPVTGDAIDQVGAMFDPACPKPIRVSLPPQFQNFGRVFSCKLHYVSRSRQKWLPDKKVLAANFNFGIVAKFDSANDRVLAENWLAQQNEKIASGA